MTLPFENDTSAIVKKLAGKSIKANRRRNIFIILTIVIATAMFSTLCLVASGFAVTTLNNATNFTAAYTNIPESKVDLLAGNSQFDKAGIHCRITERKIDNNTLNLLYMDKAATELGNVKIDGNLPEHEHDVVVQKEFLKKLGLSASIGDTVSLNLGNGEQDYTITGFAKSPSQSNTIFSVLCSKEFLIADTEPEQRNYTVYVFLEMARAYADTELNELLDEVHQDTGLTSDCGIMLNDTTTSQLMIKALAGVRQNALMFAAITLLLILASGIVIYNIFMISVRSNIREYGQLRTMGATQKQIKRIVSNEGKILMWIGIPLGLLLSCVAAYLIMPDGFRWYMALVVCAIVFLLMLAVIKISMRSPVKTSIKTSPIEATRYGYKKDERIDRNDGKNIYMSAWNLAKVNFKRNRKKTVTIILSLSLCGILFVLTSSMLSSMDIEARARIGNELGNSDFVVLTNNTELEKDIADIPGITHIEYRYGIDFDWTFPNGAAIQKQTVSAFTKEEYEKNILPELGESALTYEQLVKENGMILFRPDYISYYAKTESCECDCNIMLSEEQTDKSASFIVKGKFIRHYETDIWAGIPTESMAQFRPDIPIYAISINGEENKWEQINAALTSLAEKNGLKYQSIVETTEQEKEYHVDYYMILYAIIFLVFLFAIINLANTVITNVVSRQQEFGVLRAVGLSKRQLLQMMYFENGLYVGVSVILSVLAGGIAGYFVVDKISIHGFSYNFPLLEVTTFIAIMALVTVTITALSVRIGAKTSIVEQINMAE